MASRGEPSHNAVNIDAHVCRQYVDAPDKVALLFCTAQQLGIAAGGHHGLKGEVFADIENVFPHVLRQLGGFQIRTNRIFENPVPYKTFYLFSQVLSRE